MIGLRTAAIVFITWPLFLHAAPALELRPWNEYRTIMWIGDSASKHPEKLPLFFERLREMGINTAMLYGGGDPKVLVENHYPYYVENIVNRGLCLKFSSSVTDWDKFITDWSRNGRTENELRRDYSLNDPQWLDYATRQMRDAARVNARNHPVAFDIRDELSTTISANPFDYDFSPIALDGFRDWLKTRYPTLSALNAEWQTAFPSWMDVRPFTTDQIKNRMASGDAQPHGKPDWQAVEAIKFDPAIAQTKPTRWNFSPWADFRTYMDLALANALNELRQAAHEIDPTTPVGIEGTQMPSAFGGYDLRRLGQVLDWVEPYDIGNAREIFGSFMPGKPMLTTVFEKDTDHARRRLWHLLLEGDRGCLVWWSEDCIDWSSPDYALTPKAKALAPVMREMTAPLARLFLRAVPERDPIAIQYSQASVQADWLLESTVDGSTWLRRFSSFEAEHNHFTRMRNAMVKAIEDAGYRAVFVASDQIEKGELERRHFRALVTPESFALSEREAARIHHFYEQGGVVLSAGPVGSFDEHCKLRTNSLVEPWIATNQAKGAFAANKSAQPTFHQGNLENYAAERLQSNPPTAWPDWFKQQLASVPHEVIVSSESRTLIHRFAIGTAQLIALERNINYQMSEELAQAGGNESLEKALEVEVSIPKSKHIYDLRRKIYMGQENHFDAHVDPWQPALFVLLDEKVDLDAWLAQAVKSAE